MRYTKEIGFEDIKISLLAIWKNIAKCVISAIAFFVIGLLITFSGNIENYYSSSTSLYCVVNGNYAVTASAAEAVVSYASVIRSQKVAERAVSYLGNTDLTYKDIQNMISYTTSDSGMNIKIVATSSDPEIVIKVANAVADAFAEEMRTITGVDAVHVLNEATDASLSQNGLVSLWISRMTFFVIGFVLMMVIIFVKELFSDKIRSVEQCRLTDDDIVLGVIPNIEELNK